MQPIPATDPPIRVTAESAPSGRGRAPAFVQQPTLKFAEVADILRTGRQVSVQALDKCNVLIVDNEGVGRETVQRALRSLRGIVIKQAATAEAALDALAAHKIDLIISDIFMPGLDDRAFLSALQSDGYNVPVIALSDRGTQPPDTDFVALAADYGAAGCLAKSAPAGEIRAAVMAILPDIDPAR